MKEKIQDPILIIILIIITFVLIFWLFGCNQNISKKGESKIKSNISKYESNIYYRNAI